MLKIPQIIKDQFKTDGVLKNIRIVFPNGEREDICNDRLIKESLKFDESISSREIVKFGLCESNQISFECVGIDDIKGLEIAVFIEIDTTGTEIPSETAEDVPFPFYRIPLGHFIVDEAKLDSKMLARKVTGYSRLNDLPSHDWWTSLDWWVSSIGSNLKVDFDTINFIAATNKGLFDDTDREVVDNWSKGQPFSLNIEIGNYTFRLNDINGWYAEIDTYSASAPWPTTHDLGRLDKCILSDEIEASLATARSGLISANVPENIVDQLLQIVRYYIPFNPVSIYRNSSKYSYAAYYVVNHAPMTMRKGKQVEVGELFIMPWELAVFTSLTISYGGNDYHVSFLDSESDIDSYVQISKVTLFNGNYRAYFPVVPSRVEEDSPLARTFALPILSLDMRKLLEATAELWGKFGHINRYGYFDFLSIAEVILDGLFPAEDLFPAENLYPKEYGLATVDLDDEEIIPNNATINLWYERNIIGFGRILSEYTSSDVVDDDGNPAVLTYEKVVTDDDALLTYDITDNEIIKRKTFTENGLDSWLLPLSHVLETFRYYRTEVETVGLPYIEAGDQMMVYCHNQQLLVLNLSRTLSGIQSLRDKAKTD